jgi:hypothetical protein
MTVVEAVRLSILNQAGSPQPILRQAKPPGAKILSNLFVLESVEAEVVQ